MTSDRVQLLVSVRDPVEALTALEGGADIIDVKEPARGPMGMADLGVIEQVLTAIAGRTPVSVALGELADDPPIEALPVGVTYAKIGLHGAGPNWRALLARQFVRNPRVQPVAVAYVDDPAGPTVDDVRDWCVRQRAAALLLDTLHKDGRDLFACTTLSRRQPGALPPLALAGSLNFDAIPAAIELGASVIAVRGAACRDGRRTAPIDAARVRKLASVIAAAASPAVVHAG